MEQYRKRFPGTPEHVVNFLFFVAEEVRQLLAHLGYRHLGDIIGRSDLLARRTDVSLEKLDGQQLDLAALTHLPDTRHDRTWLHHSEHAHTNGTVLDDHILSDCSAAIAQQVEFHRTYTIRTTDRSVGGRISGEIARQWGNAGLANPLHLEFHGAAGQSFGVFNSAGLHLTLIGEANDYVGKGMNGGVIAIRPPATAPYDPAQNVIVGNTCLYGATGGLMVANGRAGERFGVRNSGAKAVVEGTGDHCCEYMTGGVIVVLGTSGRNVGAGMTGGIAYFLDEDGQFHERLSQENLKVQRVRAIAGQKQLHELIERTASLTGSPKAKHILSHWNEYLPRFWQLVPPSEQQSPEAADHPVVSAKV
jgi:glutamate synthase (ferredoxin)